MSYRLSRSSAALALVATLAGPWLATALPAQDALDGTPPAFVATIRPLLEKYCLECHATDRQKGDLDLERFASMAEVEREPTVWQEVAEQLADGAMPPDDAAQPEAAERALLTRWVRATLDALARADAGDPGPVVLRRLSNAEYGYTLRDLTGLPELDPAREFPVDGAAGEGFTNVGNALVMSPTLLAKYLDAAKGIAEHAVLLPDGIRFSPYTTRRDWTEELLAEIRAFYSDFTDPTGSEVVDLQGIVFATNEGGRLPIERYLAATLALRDVTADAGAIDAVAHTRGISPRYLLTLLGALQTGSSSPLLGPLRAQWRASGPDDVPALAARITEVQRALWKFSTIGHIGKLGGPKAWLEPVEPLTSNLEFRHPLPSAAANGDITLYLVADDAGDGDAHDSVRWNAPRFVAPGRPDILLRDVRDLAQSRREHRSRLLRCADAALAAAAEVTAHDRMPDLDDLARRHAIAPDDLRAWLACVGIGEHSALERAACFAKPLDRPSQYDFVTGWGDPATPIVVANSSDELVRIPGTLRAHSIALHPSPTQAVAVGWCSPDAMTIRVDATIRHAHPDCGNGVTWSLELRRGTLRQILARGTAPLGAVDVASPIEGLSVQAGDLVTLRIAAGDGDHRCDLTDVELTVTDTSTAVDAAADTWKLAADCSTDLLAANPHADRQGNPAVWYFFAEPDQGDGDPAIGIPRDAILRPWQTTAGTAARARLALELRRTLDLGEPSDSPPVTDHPFADGGLSVRAPSVVTIRVPAELVAGTDFATSGTLADPEGSVQLQILDAPPADVRGVRAAPFVVAEGSAAHARIAAALDEFRSLFPAALCYAKIVPVDEVVTLTHFHREDAQLVRLMLDGAQTATLDRLWDELLYVSLDALTQVDAFEQLWQYATQDADPAVFEPLRAPIAARAAAFRERLLATEPAHLAAVQDFASRAYRRPLEPDESARLAELYRDLRDEGMAHDAAIRLLIARVLIAPSFLYRAEQPVAGSAPGPVDDFELATRLSYFLWSSTPDAELGASAARGALHEPAELVAQARRMLRHPNARRLAIEFGCAWLHVYAFDEVSEKSERHFPTFGALRPAMYEETIRFLAHVFQDGGSVLDLLAADYTFLDSQLAEHYGIPGVTGDAWRRVDGVGRYGRGGILTLATTLATQSGASRTSPILRGNWLSEVLLGEKLPRPPKGVPQLPEDEVAESLSVRELTERHTSDQRCARCHQRIDAFGFSMEAFDAIGRLRERDLGGRPIDTRVKVMDGAEFDGVPGLRDYLLSARRGAFLRQFCRKLLGYSLGRAVRLSDEPLLAEMLAGLEGHEHRFDVLVDTIVTSPQFTSIRGADDARGVDIGRK